MSGAATFDGAVAVVTGGASGIGEACAARLAELGAEVAVADVAPGGGRGEPLTDVSDEQSLLGFANYVGDRHGRIDHVVLAAGVVLDGPAPLLDAPLDTWHRILDVNLTGVLLSVRALVPLMTAGGTITIITSGESQHATIDNGAYCVSKAGAWMLTKMLALELAPQSIRVNAVAPGFIETPMTAPFLAGAGRRDKLIGLTPVKRIGQPADVAAAVVYLAGESGSFVTGTTLWVDGGLAVNER